MAQSRGVLGCETLLCGTQYAILRLINPWNPTTQVVKLNGDQGLQRTVIQYLLISRDKCVSGVQDAIDGGNGCAGQHYVLPARLFWKLKLFLK